jgi:hypothetical protein
VSSFRDHDQLGEQHRLGQQQRAVGAEHARRALDPARPLAGSATRRPDQPQIAIGGLGRQRRVPEPDRGDQRERRDQRGSLEDAMSGPDRRASWRLLTRWSTAGGDIRFDGAGRRMVLALAGISSRIVRIAKGLCPKAGLLSDTADVAGNFAKFIGYDSCSRQSFRLKKWRGSGDSVESTAYRSNQRVTGCRFAADSADLIETSQS